LPHPALPDGDEVLELEPRAGGRAPIPLVEETSERRVELRVSTLLYRVGPCRDRRAVPLLEIIGEGARARECGHLEQRHVGGRVDGGKLSDARRDSPRVWLAEHGSITVTKSLSNDFLLAIKHPAMFTACLGPLARHFTVYAVMRHPLAVLASWQTVPFPYRYGRMPGAERFDEDLRRRLWATEDRVDRQLLLLDWLFARYEQLPERNIVRYEDVVCSGGSALATVTEAARALDRPLENRNRWYDPAQTRELGERLLASEGAYWRFYSRDRCA
jgi:hypothetical protein